MKEGTASIQVPLLHGSSWYDRFIGTSLASINSQPASWCAVPPAMIHRRSALVGCPAPVTHRPCRAWTRRW